MKPVGLFSKRRFYLLLALLALCVATASTLGIIRYRKSLWLERATIEELAAVAKQDEGDVEVFVRLAQRAQAQEDWPRAARAYEHACQLSPGRLECWVGWARSMYEFADYPASEAILSNYIQQNPNDGVAYLERAALRRDAKRTDKAWSDIVQANRLLPKDGKAWALRGDISIDLATYQDAQTSFENARKFLPDSAWPLTGLYHSSFELKDLPRAEATAREMRQRFPDMVEGRFYLGEVLLESAKNDAQVQEAVRELEAAVPLVAKEPNTSLQPVLNLLLGRAYYKEKDYARAKTLLETSVKQTPDNADALFFLGRTYRALGETENADRTLAEHRTLLQEVSYVRKKSVQLRNNPDDYENRLELARWYKKRGAYQSALTHYEELAERQQGGDQVQAELRELKSLMASLATAERKK